MGYFQAHFLTFQNDLDLFLSSDPSYFYNGFLSPLGNSDHVVVIVSIDFPSNSKCDAPFQCTALDYSLADWGLSWLSFERCSMSRALAAKFSDWIQAATDTCISHR